MFSLILSLSCFTRLNIIQFYEPIIMPFRSLNMNNPINLSLLYELLLKIEIIPKRFNRILTYA